MDDDLYLDTDTGDVYRKSGGSWGVIGNIKGPTGEDGSDGADGATWHNGTGAPSSGLGVDGDLYLDTDTGDVYEKASGAWSVIANIEGPQGPDGDDGADGWGANLDPTARNSQDVTPDTWVQISSTRDAFLRVTARCSTTDDDEQARLDVRDDQGNVIEGPGGSVTTISAILYNSLVSGGVSNQDLSAGGTVTDILPAGWEFRVRTVLGTVADARAYWVLL